MKAPNSIPKSCPQTSSNLLWKALYDGFISNQGLHVYAHGRELAEVVSQCFYEAVGTGSAPVEEIVECLIHQASKICLSVSHKQWSMSVMCSM
eukprot:2688683-Ditylum_brightwellii.AAC.1